MIITIIASNKTFNKIRCKVIYAIELYEKLFKLYNIILNLYKYYIHSPLRTVCLTKALNKNNHYINIPNKKNAKTNA